MARYVAPHGWISRSITKLSDSIDSIERNVFGPYRSVDVPDNVKKHIQDAYTHINSAILSLQNASRELIEADAGGLSEEKEVDHEA